MPAFDFYTDFETNPFDLGFDNSLYSTPIEGLPNFMGEGDLFTDFETNPFDLDFTYELGGATTDSKDKGFFGGLTAGGLIKDLAPVGASLIGGKLANQAALNYDHSSKEAAAIIAMANQQAQEQQFGFGLRSQDLNASNRINDANQQLAMQNSAPFRNIQTRRGAQAIAGSGVPTSNALAGRYQMMFA